MRAIILALLLAVMAGTESARAACPAHATAITASPAGEFRVCPAEVDAAGKTVGQAFYSRCDVTAVWGAGQTATVTVAAPLPGVAYLVGFPAAVGAGGATATCTNANGLQSPIAASVITFPAPVLAAPKPPALLPWPGGPVP